MSRTSLWTSGPRLNLLTSHNRLMATWVVLTTLVVEMQDSTANLLSGNSQLRRILSTHRSNRRMMAWMTKSVNTSDKCRLSNKRDFSSWANDKAVKCKKNESDKRQPPEPSMNGMTNNRKK